MMQVVLGIVENDAKYNEVVNRSLYDRGAALKKLFPRRV